MASRKGKGGKNSLKGRPSKYKPEYCKQLIDFFSEDPYREEEITITYKNGDTRTDYKMVANDLPFFSAFARKPSIICLKSVGELG